MKRHVIPMLLILSLVSACGSMETQYQRDADLYRISHLIHYGEMLREYFAKEGRYPFQGESEMQLQVTFATDEQTQYLNQDAGDFVTRSAEEFRSEISRVLGRDIQLRFEPQRVPTTMPLYYLYIVEGDKYYFVIHLYNSYSFAGNRGPHFNQIEITNDTISHDGFWKYEDLIADPQFQSVAEQSPERSGWFAELEQRNN